MLPLFVFGSVISAIRLALDAAWPEGPLTMYFGIYFLMPVALAWVGFTRRWGAVRWKTMALTMVVVAFAVWGLWNTIAYTTGQFLEWTHGRFFPGEQVVAADGTVTREGARAAPLQDTAVAKVGAGLLHGLISSVVSSAWCVALGTLLIWLPARAGRSES